MTDTQQTYSEWLRMPQWQRRREMILKRDAHRCRHCGGTGDLQVHHRQYHRCASSGLPVPPWQYDGRYLVTLCGSCHREGHRHYRVPWFDAPRPVHPRHAMKQH